MGVVGWQHCFTFVDNLLDNAIVMFYLAADAAG